MDCSNFDLNPKPKINQVCFISDFRNLNKRLKPKPYPMPQTNVHNQVPLSNRNNI